MENFDVCDYYLELRDQDGLDHAAALQKVTDRGILPKEMFDQVIKDQLSRRGLYYEYIKGDPEKDTEKDMAWKIYRSFYEVVHHGEPTEADLKNFDNSVRRLQALGLLDENGLVK